MNIQIYPYKKTIRMNIRIYVCKKRYKYDTNKYLYWKRYEQISEYIRKKMLRI